MRSICGAGLTVVTFYLAASSIHANDNGLARTPPMGWRSWNFMKEDVSQQRILAQVKALAARATPQQPSLLDVGYTHIGIDDGWQHCGVGVNHSFHDGQGKPIIDTAKFPDMKGMVQQARALGVEMGWYGNNCGCSEADVFSCGHVYHCDAPTCSASDCGHVVQDAQATAALGFTATKIDGCGPSANISAWAAALNATGTRILLEDCLTKQYTWNKMRQYNWTEHSVHLAQIFEECPGHFFRLGDDIGPQFMSTMYNLIWTYQKALYSTYSKQHGVSPSRPGCWVYPDMLEVGIGLNTTESRTHFAAWAVTSAPLAIGFDLANATLYDELYPIIANRLALSVNQQWAGNPGNLVANATEYEEYLTEHGAGGGFLPEQRTDLYPVWQIWRKPLNSPEKGQAVLVINLSPRPQDVTVSYADVDISLGDAVKATDVWSGKGVPTNRTATVLQDIEPHGCVFLILTPA